MSLPDRCPFCGAGVLVMEDGKECRSGSWVTFGCFTMIGNGVDGAKFKSRTCEDAERAHLAARVAELEAENKAMRARVSELEAEAKQAREDEAWAKQNLAYVSMGEDGCWAGMYDRDASEERGLVERVDTIADALSALRDMVEGGAR